MFLRFFCYWIIFIIISCSSTTSYAENEEILESQKESLNISNFIEQANKFTGKVFEDIDVEDLLNSAIKGNVDNSTILKKILGLFGNEVRQSITTLR